MLTARFCFEMGSPAACKPVAGTVEAVFGIPTPISSPINRRGKNATGVVRRASSVDLYHPSSGTTCQDLFSPQCVEKILRYCVSSNSSVPAKEIKQGCEMVPSICIVASVFPGGLAACLNPACLDKPHGKQCLQAMQSFCFTQPPSWHCSPFQFQKKRDNSKTDPLEMHRQKMQAWVQDLATPPGDKSYNDMIYRRRSVVTDEPSQIKRSMPPALYPSTA